jgi:hypothetical protein
MSIQSKDISIILQGPIEWTVDQSSLDPITITCMHNLRKILPDSEIILSTWENEKIGGLDFDKVVLSKLPEQQGNWPSFIPNNVNRQIVSTISGIKKATRKYCLKIRTDMILMGAEFIKHFEERRNNKSISESDSIFKDAVVTNNFSSRNTKKILKKLPDHPLSFHFSDHIQFGNTSDLTTLWDIPLQNDEDANYFLDRSHPNKWRLHELSKLSPEQYIFTTAIRKKRNLDIQDYADIRNETIRLSEYFLNSHFVILPDLSFPVSFPKYHNEHHFSFDWMRISHLADLMKEIAIKYDSQGIEWIGFSNPEPGFRWTDNFYSSIRFEWEGESFDKGLLEICFDTYYKQRITLILNGINILETRLHADKKVFKIDIANILNGENVIDFILPDAKIPEQGDSRRLALALRYLSIREF